MNKGRVLQIAAMVAAMILGVAAVGSAQDTLAVDFGSTIRPARPIATGLHGNWSDAIPEAALVRLRPRALHGGYTSQWQCDVNEWEPGLFVNPSGQYEKNENLRVSQYGAIRVTQVWRPWCWIDVDSCDVPCGASPIITPDSTEVWGIWAAYLEGVLDSLLAVQDSLGIDTIAVTFWTEANLCESWPCEATGQQFYEFYLASRDTVKSRAPDFLVAGPSLGGVMLDSTDIWWKEHQDVVCASKCGVSFNGDRPTLVGFLEFCDSVSDSRGESVFPDIIDWHSFPEFASSDNTNDVLTELLQIKAYIRDSTGTFPAGDTLFSISESMSCMQFMVPGSVLWHIVRAEQAREHGLLWMNRTYWGGEGCDPNSPDSGQVDKNLAGLIDPDLGPTAMQPRSIWWLYQRYASMDEDYVSFQKEGDFVLISGRDLADTTTTTLVGRFQGENDDSLRVRLENLGSVPGLIRDGLVEVRVEKYSGTDWWTTYPDSSSLEVGTLDHRYFVEADSSLTISFVGAEAFGERDAFLIQVSRPKYVTIAAAQSVDGIQNALLSADLGDQVEAEPLSQNRAYYPVTMKRRVAIRPAFGTPIIASSADSIPVVFGADADSFTVLSGFRIEGRSAVSTLVALRGQARLIDCDIRSMATSTPRLISVESGQPTIRACTIATDTVSYAATGIYIAAGAAATIDSCEIIMDNGHTQAVGVVMAEDSGSALDMTWSYVTTDGSGAVLWGDANIRNCTFHDVLGGITGNGSSNVIENTIVSGPYLPGIYGYDVRYCLTSGTITGSQTGCWESADPLYCAPDSVAWPPSDRYTLRADSHGSPTGNGSGELIGAFPVRCMFGELQSSTVVAGGTELGVWGDTRVPLDKTLRIEAGAILEVDGTDNQGAGFDSAKVELRVDGDLYIAGTENSPVTIRGATGTRGEWSGLVLSGGYYPPLGKRIKHAIIEDAKYAIRDSLDDPIAHLYLEEVEFRNFETAGLYLSLGSSVFGASACSVMTCTFDMRGGGSGAPYGIYCDAEDAYALTIESTSIVGDAGGVYGLYLNVQGNDPTTYAPIEAVVRNVTVDSLSAGTGVYVAEFSPELAGIDVTKCKWGIQLRGTESPSLQKVVGNSNENDLVQCTTGLYVGGSVDVDIQDVNITVPQYQTGLYADGTSAGTYDGLAITGGGTGFQAWSTGSYTVRSTKIENFTTYGVRASSASLVDLGTINDPGNNIIRVTSGSPLKVVTVKNRVAGLGDIMAEKNYWGTSGTTPPTSSWFSTGIDYDPWLTESQMPSLSHRMQLAVFPTEASLAFRPNPFLAGGVVQFTVPEVSGSVDVSIFDLRGRLVRTLARGEVGAGEFEVAWDGKDARGGAIASGIYFLRMTTASYDRVIKIVKLR